MNYEERSEAEPQQLHHRDGPHVCQRVLEFDVLDHNASLELEIPVVAYRFDQQEWRIQSPGEMWHTELPEKIEFRIPGTSLGLSVDADVDTGKKSVVYSRGLSEETIICDLMQLRSWLGREMFRHDIDEKIAIRHLYASALSFFFKEYPRYFSTKLW